MNRRLLLSAAPLFAGVLFAMSHRPSPGGAAENADRVLRHVVLFKFKADATAEQIREIEQAFAKLPEEIDAVKDFEWGTDNSPEMLSQGFTHCFLVTFKDEEGRAAYLPHPAHQAFVAKLKPILEEALVVDYWTPRE
jgi:quinol monooxygenase YgiN